MKIVTQSAELMPSTTNLEKDIENIARICYKSEGVITNDSHKKFINNLLKRGHEAMLEHSQFCFELGYDREYEKDWLLNQIHEIMMKTVGMYLTNEHEAIIISCNVRTLRDAKKYVNNKLVNDLINEAMRECELLFQDLVIK